MDYLVRTLSTPDSHGMRRDTQIEIAPDDLLARDCKVPVVESECRLKRLFTISVTGKVVELSGPESFGWVITLCSLSCSSWLKLAVL
jgi:hypothetical protein